MSKEDKPQKITFKSVIRLVIFLFLAWLIISFLSQQSQLKENIDDPTVSIDETMGGDVLGEMYSRLPQDSRNQIENFDKTETGKFFYNSFEYVKEKLDGFPQKQIKDIKKGIIKNMSEEMIRQVDEN